MDETLREQVFFLDVNVPMYAAGKDHPYKAPCARLMREIAEGRLAVVMRNNGLTTIISTDKHFDLIVELTRLEPQALFR